MAQLKKYDLEGNEVGVVSADAWNLPSANSQMIKDYIIAIRENARQWSANTKGRSEVKHTTKKPHPQKGGGRSRQGSLVAPQYRGGGRVFGPKPKFDQHVKINKKEKRAAIRSILAEKIQANQVLLINSTEVEAPKTKKMAGFMSKLGLEKRVLFLGEGSYIQLEWEGEMEKFPVPTDKHDNFVKSIRNIPQAEFSRALTINGYELMKARHVIMTEEAFKEICDWLL